MLGKMTNMTIGKAMEVLGLSGEYDWSQLRQAYLGQVRLWHPDGVMSLRASMARGDGNQWPESSRPATLDLREANDRMVSVNLAYETLRADFGMRGLSKVFG